MSEHVSKLLSAYIDEEVTRNEAELVEKHLTDCSACYQEYKNLKWTKQFIGDTYENVPVPLSLENKIINELQASEQENRSKRVQVAVAAGMIFMAMIFTILHFIPGGLTLGSSLLRFSYTLLHASALSLSTFPYLFGVLGVISIILMGVLAVVVQRYYLVEKY